VSNYTRANTEVQWFQDDFPGADLHLTKDTEVVVLHTTESTDWPGYDGGAKAPNYTGKPNLKACRIDWRAHFPDEKSSRALRNLAGGVETNTLNAVQVELVGTCDPIHKTTWGTLKAGVDYIYWPNAPRWALNGVGAFLADQHKRHGLKLEALTFQAYPASFGARGATNTVRMSFEQWRAFAGVCGHQHVPENSHGDPGDIDIDTILARAKAITETVKEPDFLAATWNVFHGTPITTLEPILKRLRKANVSLFLIQEGTNPELPAMLGRAGLEAVKQGQNVVAYDLNLWPSIAEKRVVLSDKTFQRANGEESPLVVSPSVILSDRQGRTLTALSYHLPPHVQVGGDVNPGVPKRVEITEDAMATMRDLANAAKTRAILFGGDDNFDERLGVWDKLRMAFTGLRLVQAPNPTHGDRKIDDFRVKGLEPGRGWTPDGGGDHKVHVRGFTWK